MKWVKKIQLKLSRLCIKIFGNVQFFEWPLFIIVRGDTHYKTKGPETRVITNAVRPGDILLRRYNRYVSGWFIPGYFTHVGMYVGESEVLHATTYGVCLEDILTFCRADEVVVLRPKAPKEVKGEAIKMARSLIGREYDFLFDASDDERFYCSEVPKYCYPSLFNEIGSGAIPPDAYLEQGLKVIHDSREYRSSDKD